ncbi:hypothetical protein BG004_007348 [Podila humilis]|nr:hypothetical protein BG004_007348 [Podila humilis]
MKWIILALACLAVTQAVPVGPIAPLAPSLPTPPGPAAASTPGLGDLPLPNIASGSAVPNNYLITIEVGFDVSAFKKSFQDLAATFPVADPKPVILTEFTVVIALHVIIPDQLVESFKKLPGIKRIEEDRVLKARELKSTMFHGV